MTPTLPVLRSDAPWIRNEFVQIICCGQDLSVPMQLAGKIEQVFLRRSVRVADRIWMTSDRFYVTSENSF